jgi:hypothetical protein
VDSIEAPKIEIGVGRDAIVETPAPGESRTDESVVSDPERADGPDLDPGEEVIEWEGKTWPVVRRKYVSEDEYVSAELEITRGLLRKGLKDHDGQRLVRTEKYARWRYRGFLAGEIHSL